MNSSKFYFIIGKKILQLKGKLTSQLGHMKPEITGLLRYTLLCLSTGLHACASTLVYTPVLNVKSKGKSLMCCFGKGLVSYKLEQKPVAAKPDVVEEEEMPVQTVHGLGGTREAGQT